MDKKNLNWCTAFLGVSMWHSLSNLVTLLFLPLCQFFLITEQVHWAIIAIFSCPTLALNQLRCWPLIILGDMVRIFSATLQTIFFFGQNYEGSWGPLFGFFFFGDPLNDYFSFCTTPAPQMIDGQLFRYIDYCHSLVSVLIFLCFFLLLVLYTNQFFLSYTNSLFYWGVFILRWHAILSY